MKLRKLIPTFLLLTFVFIFGASAVEIQPHANKLFVHTEAVLSDKNSELQLYLYAYTNASNNKIGVSRIVLHDLSTGSESNYGASYSSGISFEKTVLLSKAIKGHRYYADITFSADGITTECTSNTITF